MRILLYFSILLIAACSSVKKNSGTTPVKQEIKKRGPRIIVYKTKKDYFRNVPVQLSNDQSYIVSYPYPMDLMINGKLALPTPLSKGYYLDNKGINTNVAFLQYTYEEYSQMLSPPSVEMLMKRILDKDPLLEMWDCGIRDHVFSQEQINIMNDVINSGKMSLHWTRIK